MALKTYFLAKDRSRNGFWWKVANVLPTRYAVILVVFFGLNLSYISLNNLSVALIKLVKSSRSNVYQNYSSPEDYQLRNGSFTKHSYNDRWHDVSDLNEKMQGVVLCEFIFTAGFGGLIGGRLAEIYGTKKIMGGSIFIISVLSLCIPEAIRLSVYFLTVLRLLQGFLAGMVFPTMNTVVSRWMPKSERGIALGLLLGASRLGFVLGSLITGYLCKSSLLNGWPLTFYLFGGLGIIWTVCWTYVMYDTPKQHPRTSQKELDFIIRNQEPKSTKKNVKMPYRAVLTSIPVWAAFFASISETWGQSTLPINLPMYFAHVLHYDVGEAGLLSAMPSLAQSVVMCCSGIAFELFLQVTSVSRTLGRKTFNSIGHIAVGLCLVGVTLVGYNRSANVVLLTLTLGLNGFAASGFRSSVVDMTPDFGGTIMGASEFVANTIGFIAPVIVGLLTNKNQNLHQWHVVFWITAGIYILGGICFLLGGSSELQPWGLVAENDPQIDISTVSEEIKTTKIMERNMKSQEDSQVEDHKFKVLVTKYKEMTLL